MFHADSLKLTGELTVRQIKGTIMKGLYYNGYVIAAAPYQLTDDKKWAVNIIN